MPYAILELLYKRGKGPSLTPGKIAVLVTVGAFAILTLAFVALASPSAGFTNGLCLSCHAVRAQGKALAQTSHKEIPCLTCHQRPGIMGAVGSVVDGASNLAYWANPFNGPSAATSGQVDPGRCVMCHQRITNSSDVIGSDLAVDHRHFRRVGINCVQCHGGAVHGDKVIRGRGTTKDLCLECHNGIDASQDCTLCHKKDVKGIRPVKQNTVLGLAHGADTTKTHALASLQTCVSCHQESFCKKCHGISLPHSDNFSFLHGSVAIGRVGDDITDAQSKGDATGASPEAAPAAGVSNGKSLFESTCQACHGLDRPRNAKYAGDQWSDLVERMRAKGAPLSDADALKVVEYLKATKGGGAESGSAGITVKDEKSANSSGLIGSTPAARSCLTCHQRSYCLDCHGGVEMPHKSEWLRLHKESTATKDIPACFRCHVNEECIQCHQAHKANALRFPSGPLVGGKHLD